MPDRPQRNVVEAELGNPVQKLSERQQSFCLLQLVSYALS